MLLLGRSVSAAEVRAALGPSALDDLLGLGLVERQASAVRTPGLGLVAYRGRYCVASLPPYYPTCTAPSQPLHMGPDTYRLAEALSGIDTHESALDLCCGAGLHAILLADRARRVVATDIDGRAARAARFNAALNGVTIEIVRGDLYEAVRGERFDVISLSPPGAAAPDDWQLPLWLAGGRDGLRVLGPALRGLPAHLTPRGQALVYLEGAGDRREPFVCAFLRDAAARSGLSVELCLTLRYTVEMVLLTKALAPGTKPESRRENLRRWRSWFQDQAATHYYTALARVRLGNGELRLIESRRLLVA